MQHHHCLSCEAELHGNYCSDCGQRASTHRLPMKHFFMHDMVHDIWHVDKGAPYTLRTAITHPGKVARAYINGKRSGHFNLITLALLLPGVSFYMQHTYSHGRVFLEIADQHDVIRHYDSSTGIKLIACSSIPVFALIVLLYFRRLHYNYAAHVVGATFTLLGILIIYLITKGLDQTLTKGFFDRHMIDRILFSAYTVFAIICTSRGLHGFSFRFLP